MNISMPVTLRMGDLMSDEEFFQFCQINDTLEFERDSEGNIIVMSPTGSFTGNFNTHILAAVYNWNTAAGVAGQVFDSSTGFTLPNGAIRSPDVSWIKNERWNRLTRIQKEKFAPICPDFVVEIRSKSDDLGYLTEKMREYLKNGSRLGWLIDYIDQKVIVFQEHESEVIFETFDVVLSGEDVLPGFSLDLGLLIK